METLSGIVSLPTQIKRELGNKPLDKLFKEFAFTQAQIVTDKEAACKMAQGLRKIDKTIQPNLYKFTVDFILDCLKYNIKNVERKTGIRRMLERKFKSIDEIHNLVDLMRFRK